MSFLAPKAPKPPKAPPPPPSTPTRADAMSFVAGATNTPGRPVGDSLISTSAQGLKRKAETTKRSLIGG